MALFDGVENFDPNYRYKQLAMEQGKNVANALASGFSAGAGAGASKMKQSGSNPFQGKSVQQMKSDPDVEAFNLEIFGP